MARLKMQVLGPFQANLDGAPLRLESNKVRALLIYLAMESGRPHSREVLAEMF
jgi:DNA-binding SARP family transcriptional activator